MEQIKRLVLPLLHCTPTTSFMGPGAKDGMELYIEKTWRLNDDFNFCLYLFIFLNRFDDNSSNDQKSPVGLYWVNIIYI